MVQSWATAIPMLQEVAETQPASSVTSRIAYFAIGVILAVGYLAIGWRENGVGEWIVALLWVSFWPFLLLYAVVFVLPGIVWRAIFGE